MASHMPSKRRAGRVRLTIWTDRELRDRFRAAVPGGHQGAVLEEAMRSAIEQAAKNGGSESAREGNGVASHLDGGMRPKGAKVGIAGGQPPE